MKPKLDQWQWRLRRGHSREIEEVEPEELFCKWLKTMNIGQSPIWGLGCLGIIAALITEVMMIREMGIWRYLGWRKGGQKSLRLDMIIEVPVGNPRADV